MLVSHKKRFIFTKTVKTAGTSVESYFEPHCMPDGEWQELHAREEYVSETGIIGYRGNNARGSTWYNHMPAKEIFDLIGQDTWDRYYKFTVVRNPFDKLISGFFMYEKRKQNYSIIQRAKALSRRILDLGNPIDRVKGETTIERFRSWVRKGGEIPDQDKYLIDGQECIDYYIHFEDLNGGVKHVCNCLAIPFEPTRIPKMKKGIRDNGVNIQDFYDSKTRQIVEKKYAWELERFGYVFPA